MSDIVEFRHLEYLVAIAAHGSFSRAADRVYRSQPAVSHQIKTLEADIGFPLLVRNGRDRVYPTAAGDLVISWAQTVLEQRRSIFLMARAIHEGNVPPLRLGFSSFVNGFLLERFGGAYATLFPQCDVHLSSGDTRHILKRMEQGALDCAILPMPVDRERWRVRQIAQSPLVVCMRVEDTLSTKEQLDIREISSRIKIFRDPELHPAAHSRLLEMFAEAGIRLHLASSAATPADIQLMVKQGYGLALVDQLCQLDAGLTTRPLAGLNWTADTAFVADKRRGHLAIPFIEKFLDEHGLAEARLPAQRVETRPAQRLKLII